jgi:hypothetical protein
LAPEPVAPGWAWSHAPPPWPDVAGNERLDILRLSPSYGNDIVSVTVLESSKVAKIATRAGIRLPFARLPDTYP